MWIISKKVFKKSLLKQIIVISLKKSWEKVYSAVVNMQFRSVAFPGLLLPPVLS